jgi:hypothetical protein
LLSPVFDRSDTESLWQAWSSLMNSGPVRKLAAACIIAAGFCFVTGLFVIGLTDKNATGRDYIEYWAAGQQLVHGADPYDRISILRLEQAKGLEADKPRISLSPPAAFLLVLPLGFVGAKTGLILWLLAEIGCLAIANWVLWLLFGRPSTRFHLFGYVFAPTIACLMAGQLGIFFLLGVVLFLYFHQSSPWLAGAALGICAMKPHLFLPFALALLLWALIHKAHGIAGGFLAFLLVNFGVTFGFDHQLLAQYWHMARNAGMQNIFNPTVSVALRRLVPPHAAWLQFVLEAAACIWAVPYFWSRRNRWNWQQEGMLLLLVSVACAPYAWFTDESALLPAALAGIYRAVELRRSLLPLALIGGVALIEVLASVQITSWYLVWTAPAWLAWYLYATSDQEKAQKGLKAAGELREQNQ